MFPDMCVRVLLSLYIACIVCVYSSSIITKDMIRMSNNRSPLEIISEGRAIGSKELRTNPDSTAYQQIFPPNNQESKDSSAESIHSVPPRITSTLQVNSTPLKSIHPPASSTTNTITDNQHLKSTQNDYTIKEAWHADNNDIYSGNYKAQTNNESENNLSSEDLSKQYWGHYQNLSMSFFNSSNLLRTTESDLLYQKSYDLNVLEVLQRVFECPWSLGIWTCVSESFKDKITPSLQAFQLHYPRFNREEDRQGFDIEGSDIDEGRRKLSKKLQLLLPFLMMLKMTMLPALAVMALVSGKAFLISLLSLGVALFAATVHPTALGASKRQEITPQVPQPPDQLPSNYYYVM
ncbi:uncharacterized protein LOC128983352 [Macrosteles quadrilineatus]|uniref:uncharacterized protein LOC128983352 n=1 Tax=Macrosteles quadrilineatus TaxID=74068 RepID=UPI0023E17B26|nr:uncharacterized protein LOC128983352 [Macrosteles quadrilineatus]